MPRRPRYQQPGVPLHVMGRGCRGQPIFGTDADREHFLVLLGHVAEEFGWTVFDWVLMTNHHHLVLQLEEPNLSLGMHRLHFMFGQRWNERAESTGHVFFRRYTSVPLFRRAASEAVMRYVDLNPVRAGLCANPGDWRWGGYRAIIGLDEPRRFHAAEAGLREAIGGTDSLEAARWRYARKVAFDLPAMRGCGSPSDTRPSLAEVLVPGNLESIREAIDVWGYALRDIGSHIGCSHVTVQRWLNGDREPRAWTPNGR